jgi:hypothetical protein
LQWWWQVSTAQERIGGDAGIEALRREAIERFRLHIERWLVTSQRRLFDGNPFPRIGILAEAAMNPEPQAIAPDPDAAPQLAADAAEWPVDRVANA